MILGVGATGSLGDRIVRGLMAPGEFVRALGVPSVAPGDSIPGLPETVWGIAAALVS